MLSVKSPRSKGWFLGALLAISACESGGSDGPGETPDKGKSSDGKGEGQNPDPKDTGDGPQNPDDTNTGKDENSSNDPGKKPLDCSSIKATGDEVGQVPENLTLLAANGDMVSLHDYCNDVLLIMTGTGD